MATKAATRKVDNIALSPEEEIAQLKAQLAEKDEKLAKRKGLAGWIIRTSNPDYSGTTYGIKFKKGLGFTPGEDEAIAKRICDDFGYEREFTEDFFALPQIGEQVAGNMADIIGGVAR